MIPTDLSEQLSALLQSPEAQKNIGALLSQFQQGNSSAPPSSFDLSSLFPAAAPSSGTPDLSSLLKIQQIFSRISCDDKNIALLRALRPYLHEPQKADEAIRLLQLLSVLPALQECGIFGGGQT